MRIFIAGPYTAKDKIGGSAAANTLAAIDAGMAVMERGHDVFIPHYMHYIVDRPGPSFGYEDYMTNDRAFLEVCDAIYRMPGNSAGADRETACAERLGLPIYKLVKDIPKIDRRTHFGEGGSAMSAF